MFNFILKYYNFYFVIGLRLTYGLEILYTIGENDL